MLNDQKTYDRKFLCMAFYAIFASQRMKTKLVKDYGNFNPRCAEATTQCLLVYK